MPYNRNRYYDEDDGDCDPPPRRSVSPWTKAKAAAFEDDDDDDDGEPPRLAPHRHVARRDHRQEPAPKQSGGSSAPTNYKYKSGNKYHDDSDEDDGISADFLNQLRLSPDGNNAVLKGDIDGDGPRHGQPKIVVIKDMHVHMTGNKIENFAWNKKEKKIRGGHH